MTGLWKVVLILGALFSTSAHSASVTGNAAIAVSNGLLLTEIQTLSFGKVGIPATGTYTIRVRRNGNYTGGTTGNIGNEQQNGRYRIDGFLNQSVDISYSNLNSTITGVTFDELLIPATRNLGGNGQSFFNVGGQITVSPNATGGIYNNEELSYEVTVNYQ